MHKKWEPGTLYAKAMRDITNEHNATVDAWQAAEAEAERLGRANSDLCDQIAGRAVGWELPTVKELREIGIHAYLSHDSAKRENAGCMVDPMGAASAAILAALAPFLRQPVGWELDEDEIWRDLQLAISDRMNDARAFRVTMESVRARIRPVYECKECGHKQTKIYRLEGWIETLEGYVDDVRKLAKALPATSASLEGE